MFSAARDERRERIEGQACLRYMDFLSLKKEIYIQMHIYVAHIMNHCGMRKI
jgi:hypothetical protein